MALTDYEDVRGFTLNDARLQALLEAQNECYFCWSTQDGWPVGVITSYVWRHEKLWLTSSRQRTRVKAVLRDDRVSVIVSGLGTPLGAGKTVTFKGHCRVVEDAATKEWSHPALGAAIFPGNERRTAELHPFPRLAGSRDPRGHACGGDLARHRQARGCRVGDAGEQAAAAAYTASFHQTLG